MDQPRRYNLVYVIADEWRAQSIGLLGQDPVLTPNIDAIAREGALLTRAVSTDPVCSPHRAMLMTGQYPPANGVTANCNSSSGPMGLDPQARCWSDVLADNGYRCGYIGKWHLDPPTELDEKWGEGPRRTGVVWDTWTPPHRRHSFEFWHSYGCCDRHLTPHYWTTDAEPQDRIDVARWSPEHETDVAIDFLRERDPSQPFALVVSYNPPHMPFDEIPEHLLDPYRDAAPAELLVRPNVEWDSPGGRTAAAQVGNYFAAITGVDAQIGRLVAALRAENLYDETLLVLTSDHGEAMGSQGLMGKCTWYEESVRVPSVWRLPGTIPPHRNPLLLSTPDLYPTLLGLLGLADQTPPSVEGRDLSAALTRAAPAGGPDTALFAHLEESRPVGAAHGLITHDWTYARLGLPGEDSEPSRSYLFDNASDPYQQENLAGRGHAMEDDLRHAMAEELLARGYLSGR